MKAILCLLLFLLSSFASLGKVPETSRQLVLGISPSWGSSHVELQKFIRENGAWRKVGDPIPARLGKKGSAWGLGLHPLPPENLLKREGDLKSPAGIFRLGGVWGYPPQIQKHPSLPYRQVTSRDLWVEDANSPSYNHHLILPHPPKTKWEKKQQMKQGDYAHELKLFIAHNAPPQVRPGFGSSIFFHIWRGGGSKPTAGCTTLAKTQLQKLIAWIDPTLDPIYVLLPKGEYLQKRAAWRLP